MDYCVYPTSLLVHKREVVLTLGHNDMTGYVTTLPLHALMESLVAVPAPP